MNMMYDSKMIERQRHARDIPQPINEVIDNPLL